MLTWLHDHAEHFDTYAELEKNGRRVESLDKQPFIFPANGWLFDAFMVLDTCRQIGMASGPIPWDSTVEYGRRALGMDDDDADMLWRIVHRADSALRAHRAKASG